MRQCTVACVVICLIRPLFPYLAGVVRQRERALDEDIARYRRLALAETTKKAYSTQLKSYVSFCEQMNYSPVPANIATIMRYTASLAKRLSPQSISSYLNVIRLLHLESMITNPLENNHHLSTLLKGIKRDKGVQVKQALPITPDILLQMRSVIDLSAPYWATFWAACVLCFSHKEQLVSIEKSQSFYSCKQSKYHNSSAMYCPGFHKDHSI